ncbi:3803_t:CDS:2, partial [Cetraspora pellucida]
VFEYLDDRDEILGSPNPKTYSSLFSCLLVNSHWCESVIPILWRHPFHRCHKRGGELLIQTFLSCLDNSERQQLYNDGVYVPGGKYDLPVFNYPTFLKNFDYFEMISFVKSWCKFYLEDGTEESVSAILRSILKLFVARSAHLNTLSIRSTSCEEKYMLLTEPAICPLIKPLKNLYINCYSIDRLNTAESCPKVNLLGALIKQSKKLALLIENQRGLKRIILSRCKKFANIIIPSLEKQKRTLRHVGFRGIDFEGCCKWDTLKYCSKLEKLDIVDCYNINDTMISPLLNHNHHKNFKNLKYASVYNCRPIRINDKLESWAYRIYCRQRQYC